MPWRRVLDLVLACVLLGLLILVIVPDTWHEALVLSLFCSLGLLLANFAPTSNETAFVSVRGMLNVASCYLPATVLVLRRPNSERNEH